MKYKLTIIFLFIFTFANAQYNSKIAFKFGLNYVFGPKKANINGGLNFKTGITFRTSDYIYVGPQFSLNKFFSQEGSSEKSLYTDLDVLVQVLMSRLINQEIINSSNPKIQQSNLALSFALGFNLDKNSINQQLFNFSRFGIGADVYSTDVLNNGLNLNTNVDLFYKRALLKSALGIGLGGAVALEK